MKFTVKKCSDMVGYPEGELGMTVEKKRRSIDSQSAARPMLASERNKPIPIESLINCAYASPCMFSDVSSSEFFYYYY